MRTLVALLALALAGGAMAQESKVALKDAPGKDRAMQCTACHSVDYVHMNSRFLDKAGWTASVNKMIKVFGAQISNADVEIIADYLARNYGRPAQK
ncbi:MAG: cytochrome c [Betaproteobacteria bacterium]|nr:cytochrome c [Betaproteobacteria bacterium]